MWSDQHDNEFKKAADASQPAFDEKSWDKMKALLDEHLPEKKKRRRFIFWLPLGIAAGLIVWLMLMNTGEKNDLPATTAKERPSGKPDFSQNKPNEATSSIDKKTSVLPGKTQKADPGPVIQKTSSLPGEAETLFSKKKIEKKETPEMGIVAKRKNREPQQVLPGNDRVENNAVPGENISQPKPAENPVAAPDIETKTVVPEIKTDAPITNQQQETRSVDTASTKTIQKEDSIAAETVKPKTPRKSKKSGELMILVSAGADLSYANPGNPGQVKMQTGLGLAYRFAKRWRVSTGFYVVKKVYTADSSYYNPPPVFWNYYPNFQYADASCLVYEIPVSLAYHFPSVKKHDFFVSAGISSVIMKEETYNYAYKTASGDLQHRERTIRNENRHLFSTLQFSGGYSYRVSPRFSLMAEPYIKLPVSGIGYGKVNLKSTGILFTAGFKPFSK